MKKLKRGKGIQRDWHGGRVVQVREDLGAALEQREQPCGHVGKTVPFI